MDMRYDFRIRLPNEKLSLVIRGSDNSGPLIVASLTARRYELTDAALLRAFFGTPLLTLKVIGGIHWEALRLWLKGIHLQPRPPAPERDVTVVILPHRAGVASNEPMTTA
jgi:hypothetical protein